MVYLLAGGDGNDEPTGGKSDDSFQCGGDDDKIIDLKAIRRHKRTNDCKQL
jgi:hypothetical protein